MLRCDANRGSSSPAASLSRRFLAPTCQGKRKTLTINNHSKWLSNSFLTFREHDLDPPKTDSCLSDFFSKSWNRGRYRIQWPASGCAGNDVRWTGIAGEWFAKMFKQETSSNFWIRGSGSLQRMELKYVGSFLFFWELQIICARIESLTWRWSPQPWSTCDRQELNCM